MKTHELKSWPLYFQAVFSGHKRFELRNGDRGFAVGDVLWLREWDDKTGIYSGREIRKRVTYILEGGRYILGAGEDGLVPISGLLRGFVIMSLEDFHG